MGEFRRVVARVRRGATRRNIAAALQSGRHALRFRIGRRNPGADEPASNSSGAITDIHELRELTVKTVLRTLHDIPAALAPPTPRTPWRIAILEEDRARALARLRRLPAPWKLSTSRGALLLVTPYSNRLWRRDDQSADVTAEISFVRFNNGLIDGARHTWLENVTVPTWQELTSAPRPDRLATDLMAMTGPIDVVYTWVDGTDPSWLRRRAAAAESPETPVHHSPNYPHPSATDAVRYISTDELRYSLRSVYQFANWVRKIYIVTDGQTPRWLNTDHARIVLVDHREILPSSSFNSHAIESALHRIAGLAEHYLYLNDDVFFGRIAYPADYFHSSGVAKFFPSDLPIAPGPVTDYDLPIMAAAKNGRELLRGRFGLEVQSKIRHTVHPQLRSVLAEM